ncbi:hypothetical protein [Solirubrobacter soli]|uniref:hypothetical protein n=1 Tax=Solirubrobacter soli TaxID=363832 RepID=UPI000401C8F7|nr:hypothetical protein [Solirubrobacter soli]
MRLIWIVIGLVAVAAAIAIVPRLGNDGHTPRPGHPETVAASIALTYARAVQVGDAEIACGTMTIDAARAVGCGSGDPHPRACGDFSIPGTKVLAFERVRAAIRVGSCRVELVPGAQTEWAVAEVNAS